MPGAEILSVRWEVLARAEVVVAESPTALRWVRGEGDALADPRTVLNLLRGRLIVRGIEIEALRIRYSSLREAARDRPDRMPVAVARIEIHTRARQTFQRLDRIAQLREAIHRQRACGVLPAVARQERKRI